MNDIRRIIILRALFLGDLLCATPTFRALKQQFPQAEITLVGMPWAATLVERLPYLDHFLAFPGYSGIPEVPFDEARTATFFAETQATGYDLALQMHGSGVSTNGFVAALGASRSIGYALDGDTRLDLNIPHQASEHEVLRWLRMVEIVADDTGSRRAFDTKHEALQIDFPTTRAEQEQAEILLFGGGEVGRGGEGETSLKPPASQSSVLSSQPSVLNPQSPIFYNGRRPLVVGLHPGCKEAARRWPAERFAALATILGEIYGARFVVTGGPEEYELAQAVCDGIDAPVLNLAGQTNLGTFAAVIAKLDLLVSNDTGAAHFAAAAGTPSIVLYGPSRPQEWAALNTVCHSALDARTITGHTEDGALALAALPLEPVLDACVAKLGVVAREVGAL